jgi:hypothetical protein
MVCDWTSQPRFCRRDSAEHRGEDYPLDSNAEATALMSVSGVESLERHVHGPSSVEGVVLRDSRLQGPGSGEDASASAGGVSARV